MAHSETCLRRWGARLIFPVTIAGALGLTWLALDAGMEPALALGAVSMMVWLVVGLGERWLPYRTDWNRSRGDVRTDILHVFFSSYATIELAKLMGIALLLPVAEWAGTRFGSPLWPTHWPLLLQLPLAALTIEFGTYWMHRASHELPLLWRLHAVHHSPDRLYWLNAGRDHPLGAALTALSSLPLAILLGIPADCLALYYALQSANGLFQHANIAMKLGPLNWVFSTADLHRWHHSVKIGEANHNYGQSLIAWDALFGTRYLPGTRGPERIGIDGMQDFPRGYTGQLGAPFRWARYAGAQETAAIARAHSR